MYGLDGREHQLKITHQLCQYKLMQDQTSRQCKDNFSLILRVTFTSDGWKSFD